MKQHLPVAWPVLHFGRPNCTALRFDSEDRLCRASLSGIKALASMEEYFIVDSIGQKVLLGEPRLARPLSWIGRCCAIITGAMKEIVYDRVHVDAVLTVDQLRNLVFQDFEEYADFWSELDLGEMKSLLIQAKTSREIIEKF
jgi:hypothetical protein